MRIQKGSLFRGHTQEIYQYENELYFVNTYFGSSVTQVFSTERKHFIVILFQINCPQYVYKKLSELIDKHYDKPINSFININIEDLYQFQFTSYLCSVMHKEDIPKLLNHKDSIDKLKHLKLIKKKLFSYIKNENLEDTITDIFIENDRLTINLSKKAIYER